MINRIELEGTVKNAPVYKRNKLGKPQATLEICNETPRGARTYRNFVRVSFHGSAAKPVVEGGPELGRGLIRGDRVLIVGKIGVRSKACGSKHAGYPCIRRYNQWWFNVDLEDGGSITLLSRSLSESGAAHRAKRKRQR